MMSPDNMSAKPAAATKDDSQSSGSGSRKTTSTMRPPEQALKCPRCDSPNTKFCYYNNYSLTQPRHFCKTCRRYWTNGGALRNVPIGGGCRKNKKIKLSSSSGAGGGGHEYSKEEYSGGLKFFGHGLSPAMDFQLISSFPSRLEYSSTTGGLYNNYQFSSSFGDHMNISTTSNAIPPSSTNTPRFGIDPLGFNLGIQDVGSMNMNVHSGSTTLASSIESLSSINQDLHWKLQQQRLAMLFGGGGDQNHQKLPESNSTNVPDHLENKNHHQKPQPILFQNLENSKPEVVCAVGNSRKDEAASGNIIATEWFFDNSYAAVNPSTPTNSSNQNASNWNGWSDLNQYSTALP